MLEEPTGDSRTLSAGTKTQRFIPFRRSDLVAMLADDGRLPASDQHGFRAFVRLINAVFHHDFHQQLETLKDAYAPFNPDPDTRTVRDYDDQDRDTAHQQLITGLEDLLNHANFEPLSDQDLRAAFEEESLLKVRLEIDESDFANVVFFRRGITVREDELTSFFGLRRRPVVFTNYEKVLSRWACRLLMLVDRHRMIRSDRPRMALSAPPPLRQEGLNFTRAPLGEPEPLGTYAGLREASWPHHGPAPGVRRFAASTCWD